MSACWACCPTGGSGCGGGRADRPAGPADRDGRDSVVALNALTPKARARLLRETPQGLEPAMLWLNEDGTPRAKRGWYRTFDGVNARVAPEHP